MKKLVFTKMSGTGNDFVIIDEKHNPGLTITNKLIVELCHRRNGIGADGVITIHDSVNSNNFIMKYYNADGSTGSLCANGARCAVLYTSKTGRLTGNSGRFISNGIEYSGNLTSDGMIQFFLNPPKKIKYNFKLKAANELINAHFADTGSPHVIIKIDDPQNKFDFLNTLEKLPVESLGREIRYLPEFSPGGTNVNFIEVREEAINIRSYERGVEAETLSCGTGSVAAALISYVTDGLRPPIKIITKENEYLFVNFEVENQKVKNVSLTGPAKVVFTGEIELTNS